MINDLRKKQLFDLDYHHRNRSGPKTQSRIQSESFEFSEIKIAINHNYLLYIITITTTNKDNKQFIVKPVKTKSLVNKFKLNEILEYNRKTFGIKNKHKCVNKIAIHKNDDIGGLNESECLPNLIHGKSSNCTIRKD
uniref:Uncharacterized protein n=1 Tax=Glossina pallidipes TaxID=7398 RepID=A0A1A9ZJU2_GLOPL